MGIPKHLTDILTTPSPPAYRLSLISRNGELIGSVRIPVSNDDEGLERAKSLADGHAVELWDGLRFIEYFPPLSRSRTGDGSSAG